jgi:MFS transporter, MHS family, proline/betaine transporter
LASSSAWLAFGCAVACPIHLCAARSGRDRPPILLAFETEWRTMLRVVLLCLPSGVAFYTLFVFVVSYLQTFVHVPEREALEVNTISMMGFLGWILLGGVLSDRLGRKPVAMAAMAGLLIFAWPLFDLLDHPRFAYILSAQLLLCRIHGALCWSAAGAAG